MNNDFSECYENNIKLIYFVLNRYFYILRSDEDAIQIGRIALYKAYMTYDASKNLKFSSYASRIIYNDILYYAQKKYRDYQFYNNMIRIDSKIDNKSFDSKLSIHDILEDFRSGIDLELVEIDEDKLFKSLTSRDVEILRCLDNDMNQSEIAKVLNICQSNVSRCIRNLKSKFISACRGE